MLMLPRETFSHRSSLSSASQQDWNPLSIAISLSLSLWLLPWIRLVDGISRPDWRMLPPLRLLMRAPFDGRTMWECMQRRFSVDRDRIRDTPVSTSPSWWLTAVFVASFSSCRLLPFHPSAPGSYYILRCNAHQYPNWLLSNERITAFLIEISIRQAVNQSGIPQAPPGFALPILAALYETGRHSGTFTAFPWRVMRNKMRREKHTTPANFA